MKISTSQFSLFFTLFFACILARAHIFLDGSPIKRTFRPMGTQIFAKLFSQWCWYIANVLNDCFSLPPASISGLCLCKFTTRTEFCAFTSDWLHPSMDCVWTVLRCWCGLEQNANPRQHSTIRLHLRRFIPCINNTTPNTVTDLANKPTSEIFRFQQTLNTLNVCKAENFRGTCYLNCAKANEKLDLVPPFSVSK